VSRSGRSTLVPFAVRGPLVTTASLLLAGCTATPIIVTKPVDMPVAVSCIPASLRAEPEYPDTSLNLRAAGSPERRFQLILAGREIRIGRLSELEPIVEICR